MAKLAVSIVNYNAGDYLINCLQSLKASCDEVDLKVYVVDNASSDDSISRAKKKFPEFIYILNENNLGFGKAHNIALSKIKEEFILILNPDTKILPGTLKYMLNFMEENTDVGAASCKIMKKNGEIDWASHRGFPTPWASTLYYVFKNDSLYHLTNRDLNKTHEVDAIVGAFFLTRKSVLDKVGLFDEKYFMYGEDIDLCLRIKNKGFKVMYIPEVKIEHFKGVSSGLKTESQKITTASKETKLRAFDAFYESMKIFYKKHYQKKYPFFVNWVMIGGINLKWWMARRKMIV